VKHVFVETNLEAEYARCGLTYLSSFDVPV
jgi:hypothetical protein